MKDVTDTVSPALMAKVKAWGSTLKVTEMGGGLYIAKSQHRNVHGKTADGAVRQWLLDMAVSEVNARNALRMFGTNEGIVTLGAFFRKHPEVAVQ